MERNNLARLDTFILNSILVPLSIMSAGLIVGWAINPPFHDSLQAAMFVIAAYLLIAALIFPLGVYLYAYASDRLERRIDVIRILVFSVFWAWIPEAFALFRLDGFLELNSVQYAFYRSAFLILAVLGSVCLTLVGIFVVQNFVFVRFHAWLINQVPRKLAREKIDLSWALRSWPYPPTFIQACFLVGLSSLICVAFVWYYAILLAGPLVEFWQSFSLIGWLLFVSLVAVLLARVRQFLTSLGYTAKKTNAEVAPFP